MRAILALTTGFAALACGQAHAAGFTYTIYEVPGAIATEMRGFAPGGAVIGYYFDRSTKSRGIGLRGDQSKLLTDPAALDDYLTAYGDGTFIGQEITKNFQITGYLQQMGQPVFRFQVPGGASTNPTNINAAGVIVGSYFPDSGLAEEAGFIRQPNGTFTTVQVPNSFDTELNGINNANAASGAYRLANSSAFQGFTYVKGVFTTINHPNAYQTFLTGINDRGDVGGYYQTVAGTGFTGFIYSNGVFTDIVPPNGINTYVWNVNNAGQAVGYVVRSDGSEVGFTATPVK